MRQRFADMEVNSKNLDKTRAELVAKQRGCLPLQLRVKKDCQYDNHDNSHNVTCIYYK